MTRPFYIMNFKFSDRVLCPQWPYCGVLPISLLTDNLFLIKLAGEIVCKHLFSLTEK